MTKLFDRLGYVITGMSAVTFVLVMTIIGMIFLSHGLYYQIFSKTMEPWHATAAAWALAMGWEFTVLITTCNVRFVSSRLPAVLAICSGIIVLFFIQAFDGRQASLELIMRWFIGIIVATINYVYSELFYKKWKEAIHHRELDTQLAELRIQFEVNGVELTNSQSELKRAKADIERLVNYVAELEAFKATEIEKLTCPYCKAIQSTVFKLNSHKGTCTLNPRKELKQSIFDEIHQ